MSVWQPIETAPIRRKLLLWAPRRGLSGGEVVQGEYMGSGKAWLSHGKAQELVSHWMPLPKPPASHKTKAVPSHGEPE